MGKAKALSRIRRSIGNVTASPDAAYPARFPHPIRRARPLSMPEAIHFQPLASDVAPPHRATRQSAGFDLKAYLRGRAAMVATPEGVVPRAAVESAPDAWAVELQPGERALIPLGFKARLPDGYEAQIRPRSGTSFRKGLEIPNAPGTIDADFPDEWMVIVRNGTDRPMRIEHGERIAQAVLHRFEVLAWDAAVVRVSTDRSGGFGSTGR